MLLRLSAMPFTVSSKPSLERHALNDAQLRPFVVRHNSGNVVARHYRELRVALSQKVLVF